MLYRVGPRCNRQEIHGVIGADFLGVLVSDCLNIYYGATPVQHWCYAAPKEGDRQRSGGLSLELRNHLSMV